MTDTIKIEIEFTKADLVTLGKVLRRPLASRDDVRYFVKKITRSAFDQLKQEQRVAAQISGK